MSAIPSQRALPSKEAAAFRTLLHQYETKSMKKAVKTADSILLKFPDHGETLAMKALAINSPARRAEAFELVRKGVRHDIKSHIVWHAFGLIQRSDRNMEEAIKCYQQALRCDKENMSLLRDYAALCTQSGSYHAVVELRAQILKLRPHVKQHWIALVYAYDLAGEPLKASETLDAFFKTVKNAPNPQIPVKSGSPNMTMHEWSELHLYYVKLLHEAGETQSALQNLNAMMNSSVVDTLAQKELQATLLSSLSSRREDASLAWRILIDLNPENKEYLIAFLKHKGLDPESSECHSKCSKILQSFAEQFPRSSTIRRYSLDFAEGVEFDKAIEEYIRLGLNRGVPSLFQDLKPLYTKRENAQIIELIVERFLAEISHTSGPPTAMIWSLYFIAQHHSYLGDNIKSLEILDRAINLVPTLPELYISKARALKRSANPYAASCCMEQARLLDEQDRYLNVKAGKYWIAAGEIDRAETILGLFTRPTCVPAADLTDMQAKWFLKAEARSFASQGLYHRALKRTRQTLDIFDHYEDDQFDFHGWAARKSTATAYKLMLEHKPASRSHKESRLASLLAINIYCRLHDNPSLKDSLPEKESSKTSASLLKHRLIRVELSKDSELSKLMKKASISAPAAKINGKTQREAKKAMNKLKSSDSKTKGDEDTEDAVEPAETDPNGLDLIACAQPLEEASKLLAALKLFSPHHVEVWHASYEIAKRKGSWIVAVEALTRAHMIDGRHPDSFSQALELHLLMANGCISTFPEHVQTNLHDTLRKMLEISPGQIAKLNFGDLMKLSHQSIASILSVMKQLSKSDSDNRTIIEELAKGVMNKPALAHNIDVAVGILEILTSMESDLLPEFKTLGHTLHPLTYGFLPKDEQEQEHKNVLNWSITGDSVSE